MLEYQLRGYDAYALRYGIAAFAQVDIDRNLRSTTQAKILRQNYVSEDYRDGYAVSLRNEFEVLISNDVKVA